MGRLVENIPQAHTPLKGLLSPKATPPPHRRFALRKLSHELRVGLAQLDVARCRRPTWPCILSLDAPVLGETGQSAKVLPWPAQ